MKPDNAPQPQPQTFKLEPIEPVDHAGVIAVDLAELQDDDAQGEPEERPAAGREAGFPLAKMFVDVNAIVCSRMFPDSPLSKDERRTLQDAAAEVEAYYAPELSGPWWLWARLATTAGAIYGPRMVERRSRTREVSAASTPAVAAPAPVDPDADPEVRL